jgi:hypothetical protein
MLTMTDVPLRRLVVRHGISRVEAAPVRAAASWWHERIAACSRSSFDSPGPEAQEQMPARRATMTTA